MSVLPLLLALSGQATIHPSQAGVAVRDSSLQGLPLCVWNDSSLFTTLKKGIQEQGNRVFRFPNGSTSDQYHWNGKGSFDNDSIWIPDSTSYTAGWLGELVHRGITTSTYGFVRPSLIDDGDTNTYWWSNPDNQGSPGWFVLNLGAAKSVDSFALWLGDRRPDSVQILRWTGSGSVYPPPYQQDNGANWIEVARVPAAAFVGAKPSAAFKARYLGVRPIGTKNLAKGWQVREFEVLKSGAVVTNNLADGSTQDTVYATSVHPSSRAQSSSYNWTFQTFMDWIAKYPHASPMICVNYGSGTPQEAAAWVHYANVVKGYGIKRWQIGNETSGTWEEGGCVSARQYAERFVKYAQAMRAEDPSILIEGPVAASTGFLSQASGDFDGRSWMGGILHYVDSVEKATNARLIDGIDFHDYPYWFSGTPTADEMITKCDASGKAYDTLLALMDTAIASQASREVLMTEYNTSTVSSSLEMEASAGTAAGLQFAHFVQRFGDRGVTNLWELYEGGGTGPDGTYGSLSAFVKPTQGEWSSLGYPPNASFWTTRTIVRQWLDTAGNDTIMPIDAIAGARLFAVRNAGRVSVLAFNLGPDSASISLDGSLFPTGGDILSWGTGEYLWTGTSSSARAVPDNGPSSRTFATPSSAVGAKIPPYGMLVVRAAGRGKIVPHTAHWLASRTGVTTDDTVVVSGWTAGEGVNLVGGTWSVGGVSGTLSATDGAWDGPSESWTAKIPAGDIGVGAWTLKVAVADASGDTAVDSTSIKVTGTLRPVLLISNFDNTKLITTWNTKWNAYSADGATVSAKADTAGQINSYYLKDSLHLKQPSNLGYTTYFSTYIAPPSYFDSLRSAYNVVGLVFDIRSSHSNKSGSFYIYANTSNVTDYDNYGTALPNTAGAWVRDTVLFSDLKQGGWGAAVPFYLDSLTKVEFRAVDSGTAVLSLDNVAFLGTQGNSYLVGVAAKTTRIPLTLSGRRLTVDVDGAWTLRLVGANGRVSQRWTGTGASALAIEHTVGARWAILDNGGTRRTLALPPVLR